MQIETKYFKDHVPASVFDNQSELVQTLRTIGILSILESDEVNPLTVRLFNIKKALEKVAKCIGKLQDITQIPFPTIFSKYGYMGQPMPPQLYACTAPSGSVAYTSTIFTAANDWTNNSHLPNIPDFKAIKESSGLIAMVNVNNVVHTFDLHSGTYNFFVNLDSSLDRIRLELNSIYFDGHKEIDSRISRGNKYWSNFLYSSNRNIGFLNTAGNSPLVAILTGTLSKSLDNSTSKYRNRLIHDGDLEVKIDKQTGKVFIPEDPLTTPPIFNVELLPFLQNIFSNLQALMKQIYAQVIIDIKSKGHLPLI